MRPAAAGRCGGSGPSITGGDFTPRGQRSSLRTPVEGPIGPATRGDRPSRRRSVGPLTAGPGVRRSPRRSRPGRRVKPGESQVASARVVYDGCRQLTRTHRWLSGRRQWRPLTTAVAVCVCNKSALGHQLIHTDRVSRYAVPRGRTQRWSKASTSAAISKSAS